MLPTDDEKFAVRWSRLRTVCQLLEGLHRDYANNLVAEKRQKAEQYLANPNVRSHGEREAYASANTIDFTVETLSIKGQITSLEEERDFIKFAITHDAEVHLLASVG